MNLRCNQLGEMTRTAKKLAVIDAFSTDLDEERNKKQVKLKKSTFILGAFFKRLNLFYTIST